MGCCDCDLSRPANVSREVLHKRPDVLVIDGGIVEVPNRPDLDGILVLTRPGLRLHVGDYDACPGEEVRVLV